MGFNEYDFFAAVENDDVLMVSLYIHAGANINYLDQFGRTALHVAVEKGYTSLIELLLDSGADPYRSNIRGDNALTLAINVHDVVDVAKLLLERGVDPNRENARGLLPLQEAITQHKMEHVKLLVDFNADLFLRSTNANSPFHMLIRMSEIYGIGFIKDLLSRIDLNKTDNDGNTFLHKLMVEYPDKHLTYWALNYGAKPNVQNKEGNTPLHLSVKDTLSQSTMPILLGYGADPYIRNNQGLDCFDLLKQRQEFGLLSLLRDYAKKHNLKERHLRLHSRHFDSDNS